MIRWLLLASHVPPGGLHGGMVRVTVELARALNRRTDIELSVVCDRNAATWWRAELDTEDPTRIHPLPAVPVPLQATLERHGLSRRVLDGFDVVHGTKHILPSRTDALRVLTVHDFLPLDRPHDFGLAKRALLPGPYLASIRDADVAACVSSATRDRLRNYVPEASGRLELFPWHGLPLRA